MKSLVYLLRSMICFSSQATSPPLFASPLPSTLVCAFSEINIRRWRWLPFVMLPFWIKCNGHDTVKLPWFSISDWKSQLHIQYEIYLKYHSFQRFLVILWNLADGPTKTGEMVTRCEETQLFSIKKDFEAGIAHTCIIWRFIMLICSSIRSNYIKVLFLV